MSRTFTLKQCDMFRREAFQKIAARGTQNRRHQKSSLAINCLCRYERGADFIKDFILGRPIDIEDKVVDNLLRLAGSQNLSHGRQGKKVSARQWSVRLHRRLKQWTQYQKTCKAPGMKKGWKSRDKLLWWGNFITGVSVEARQNRNQRAAQATRKSKLKRLIGKAEKV